MFSLGEIEPSEGDFCPGSVVGRVSRMTCGVAIVERSDCPTAEKGMTKKNQGIQ
jgi:hypothetical protein